MKMMSKNKRSGGAKFAIVLVVIVAVCAVVLAAKTLLRKRQPDSVPDRSNSQSSTEPASKPVDADPTTSEPATSEPETTDGAKYTEKKETVITTAKVNVRKGAGTDFESVGQIDKGTEIERLATGDNGWSRVSYKGETLYISSQYLKVKDETEPTSKEDENSDQKTVTVYTTTRVNVRKEPNTDSEIVATLNEGKKVERISKGDNGWTKVRYKGNVCYMSSKYLTESKPQSDPVKRNVVDPRGDNWNLTVVNFYNEYDSSYMPKLKKVCADYGYNIYMDERVADWYTKMYKAALKDGIKLVPISGYRSYATQEKNYKNRIKLWQSRGYGYNEAVKKTAQVILPPGTSEHNLGLAMDICCLDYNFDERKEYKWLEKHAADYGFILRYTEENKSKTGVVAEPWHWRFVGVEDAKAIKKSGLCLEDYVKTKI